LEFNKADKHLILGIIIEYLHSPTLLQLFQYLLIFNYYPLIRQSINTFRKKSQVLRKIKNGELQKLYDQLKLKDKSPPTKLLILFFMGTGLGLSAFHGIVINTAEPYTGNTNSISFKTCLEMGVGEILMKPVNFSTLNRSIKKLLGN
jgi:hypothetical protein